MKVFCLKRDYINFLYFKNPYFVAILKKSSILFMYLSMADKVTEIQYNYKGNTKNLIYIIILIFFVTYLSS